ncbi:hypothetical protein L1887_15340 [Cichorium endivia]|nr:hypothetical protein L1887_15340 [Cichorium endivia]
MIDFFFFLCLFPHNPPTVAATTSSLTIVPSSLVVYLFNHGFMRLQGWQSSTSPSSFRSHSSSKSFDNNKNNAPPLAAPALRVCYADFLPFLFSALRIIDLYEDPHSEGRFVGRNR